jgi:hypothetical protein
VEHEDDEDTEQGVLSEDDEPSWVMGTITKMVQQRIETFRQKQMKLDELTQLGWEDAADDLRERDQKCRTSELIVPAVVQSQMYNDAAATAPTAFGELIECLEIVPGILQMPQGPFQPGSIHITRGSMKLQSNMTLSGLEPATACDMSPVLKAKPVETVSFYLCI